MARLFKGFSFRPFSCLAPRCTVQRLPHLLRLLLMYQDNQNRASASRNFFRQIVHASPIPHLADFPMSAMSCNYGDAAILPPFLAPQARAPRSDKETTCATSSYVLDLLALRGQLRLSFTFRFLIHSFCARLIETKRLDCRYGIIIFSSNFGGQSTHLHAIVSR
jgi:hypothetical protein